MKYPVKRVLVTGGRDFSDKDTVYRALYDYCDREGLWTEEDQYGNKMPTGLVIVHGGARGADSLADAWAVAHWVPFEIFKPDWEKHGKAGGILRNVDMLATDPDVVIAFPGGRGTAHMVSIAKKKGTEVIEVQASGRTTFPKTIRAEGVNFID